MRYIPPLQSPVPSQATAAPSCDYTGDTNDAAVDDSAVADTGAVVCVVPAAETSFLDYAPNAEERLRQYAADVGDGVGCQQHSRTPETSVAFVV